MIVSNQIYTPNDLTQIRQLHEESLREYVILFHQDYHRCEGADEKITYDFAKEVFDVEGLVDQDKVSWKSHTHIMG